MILSFTIPGVPQQQGSKAPFGGDANKNLKPWRAVAMNAARDARPLRADDGIVFHVAVAVEARCYYPRPASHYGTGRNAGILKATAPRWKASAPDLDKLCRAIGDILTQSAILRDDALIVRWTATKEYGDPRVDLIITEADQVMDTTPGPGEYRVDPDTRDDYSA